LIGAQYLPIFLLQSAAQATDEQIDISAQQYVAHILYPELDPQVRLTRLLSEMEQSKNQLKP
jgi:hypothetical protein